MTLRQKALRAGAWTVASYSAELSSRLISNLILTRLLFPDYFGVIAAATALVVGLQLISDFGVTPAIVRSPHGEDTGFLRSAWVFQSSRGILLWLVLALLSALMTLPSVRSLFPITSVFANPIFPVVTATMGLSLILSGLQSTCAALNLRRLNFRPIAITDLAVRIVPIPIMVVSAYVYPSVWSLVAGVLIGSALRTALSHLIMPGPRMTFACRPADIKEIVQFGKWINLSSFATFISSQSDMIVLGLLLPGPTLGIYYIAKSLSDAVEALLERLNSNMTLPVLSQVLRSNPENLKDRYYRFRLPIEMVAVGSAGFLFAAGASIVHVLYDQRYSEAGPMLEILSFGLLIYPFQLIRGAFIAVGKTDVVAWTSILQAVSLVICLSLGYLAYGPLGAIAGIAGYRIVPSLAMLTLGYRANWINLWKELRWIPVYALGYMLGKVFAPLFASFTLTDIRHLFY